MKPQEEIAALRKELEKKDEQIAGLAKRVKELEAVKPASKSRQQAEEGLKLLQAGPVTKAQFATLNQKYPSDVAYYIRTILKVDVKTVRTASGSVYMTAEQYAMYLEGLKKEKAAADAAKAAAKEEVHPAATQTSAVAA
jgi:hypothetical protein